VAERVRVTTIAWDGKTLAADSMSVAGMGLKRVVPKIFRLANGWLFGGSGEYQEVLLVRDWLNGGEKPGKLDDFGGLLVKGPKEVFRIESKCVLMPIEDAFHACGSGRDFALAAMHLGRSAREAVEVALVFDAYSGGTVEELTLAPQLRAV
jgi:hypothetical protein